MVELRRGRVRSRSTRRWADTLGSKVDGVSRLVTGVRLLYASEDAELRSLLRAHRVDESRRHHCRDHRVELADRAHEFDAVMPGMVMSVSTTSNRSIAAEHSASAASASPAVVTEKPAELSVWCACGSRSKAPPKSRAFDGPLSQGLPMTGHRTASAGRRRSRGGLVE